MAHRPRRIQFEQPVRLLGDGSDTVTPRGMRLVLPRFARAEGGTQLTVDGRDVDKPTPAAEAMRKKYTRPGAIEWIK